jgi:hypothetical protein
VKIFPDTENTLLKEILGIGNFCQRNFPSLMKFVADIMKNFAPEQKPMWIEFFQKIFEDGQRETNLTVSPFIPIIEKMKKGIF